MVDLKTTIFILKQRATRRCRPPCGPPTSHFHKFKPVHTNTDYGASSVIEAASTTGYGATRASRYEDGYGLRSDFPSLFDSSVIQAFIMVSRDLGGVQACSEREICDKKLCATGYGNLSLDPLRSATA